MALNIFITSESQYFDQNTIILLYFIVFVVLQRINIHRIYEVAERRIKANGTSTSYNS